MLPIGSSGSHETSECHSSPATNLECSSALITRISGCSDSVRIEVGWMCRSPKRRPNALCWSWLSSWSRKKITRLSISASWISWKTWLPSGRARSTPKISAPITGVSLRTSMVWYPIGFSSPMRQSLREKATMSDTLVLRAATAADAAAIAATIAAAFEQYRGRLEPESGAFRETADGIAAELAHECGAILAERNGQILGCVMVELMGDDLYFRRTARVVPAARGQAIARRLIEAVEDEARRRDLAGVRLGVRIVLTENQQLFTSLGYVEISREAHEGFDHPTS